MGIDRQIRIFDWVGRIYKPESRTRCKARFALDVSWTACGHFLEWACLELSEQGLAMPGLVNINLGRSADPALEEDILSEVGSYGRQLGRIGDALGVLIKHIRPEDLSDDEKKKIWALESQLADIERVKAKRSA